MPSPLPPEAHLDQRRPLRPSLGLPSCVYGRRFKEKAQLMFLFPRTFLCIKSIKLPSDIDFCSCRFSKDRDALHFHAPRIAFPSHMMDVASSTGRAT